MLSELQPAKPGRPSYSAALCDGLTGVVFADDCQVIRTIASKAWTLAGERTDIVVLWD